MPSNPTEAQVMQALGRVIEPELRKDLVTLNMVRNVKVHDAVVDFTLVLTTPACPLRNQIEAEAKAAVLAVPGVGAVNIAWDASVPGDRRLTSKLNIGVKNAVGVGRPIGRRRIWSQHPTYDGRPRAPARLQWAHYPPRRPWG
jgi:ATP-binding protein involved in chromosome partitioning